MTTRWLFKQLWRVRGSPLGWRHLVDDLVGKNLLTYLHDVPMHEGGNFWVIWAAGTELGPHTEKVRNWLVS